MFWILDAGGGEFALYAARKTGCCVTGITLSKNQPLLAQQRARNAGLDNRVSFLLCDYRHMQGSFDQIFSIEMLEAVGHEFLGEYFKALERLLQPNGIAVVQVITTPECRYEEYRKSSDFINRHIFPGSCCPSLTALCNAMSQN